MSRADYEALILDAGAASDLEDDADDVAIFDQRMSELDKDPSARLPAEVSAALVRGSTLIRALRDWRGMRQQDLASRTALAQGYLSDIERGRTQGSAEARDSIARALEVPTEWLR